MELTIERLGHHGDGIAPGPVYVPRTLPGEVVEGDVIGGRIDVPRIVTPSPDRVKPPCPRYKSCGGCALQHASDAFVARWKEEIVARALAAHGIEAEIVPIVTSPPSSRRRATLSGRRTKSGVLVGFHAARSDVISGIEGCTLLHPDLLAAIPALEALTRLGGSRKSELSLTITATTGGVDVAVAGGKPLSRELETDLAELAGMHDLARLSWNGEVLLRRAPSTIAFGTALVEPPPGAFLQATEAGQAALVAQVEQAVGKARKVVDLFAGCGTFTLPLAARADLHAVEDEAGMLAALNAGWRQAKGLHQVTTETRDLFRNPMLPDELERFDAAVIDPPRAGAEAQVLQIAGSALDRLAYVSCNPVSFARDAAVLIAAGFRMGPVQPVDQFRWSPHVELAALFQR